jgi:hypothetical protein
MSNHLNYGIIFVFRKKVLFNLKPPLKDGIKKKNEENKK